ncbi:MAG: GPP34 family phosphoprotein [Promethearchaeota archaeon]
MLIGEEILLLILDEKKGKMPSNLKQFIRYVLPASIVEELRILGKIKIDSEGKKALIVIIDDMPTSNPLLDIILHEITNILNKGKKLKLVDFLRGISGKKMYWEDKMWSNLENKGIIKAKKGKHFLIETNLKEELEKEVRDVLGNRKEPSKNLKAIIGFFKHTRQLRFISKKSRRDKDWVKNITEDCLVPKIFARHVLLPAAMKRTTKAISVMTAYSSQISNAGAQFESSVSGTAQDFRSVRSIGSNQQKTWGGIQAAKTLNGSKSGVGSIIGGSPGDAILKGVKKIIEKRSEKKEDE